METFSSLLAICAQNSPVTGEFPAQRPVTRRFDVFFDLCPNKRLSKQPWGWWFETPSRPLGRHCNDIANFCSVCRYFWIIMSESIFHASTNSKRWRNVMEPFQEAITVLTCSIEIGCVYFITANDHHGVSNYQSFEYLFSSLFRLQTKKHERSALLSVS